MPSGSFPSAFSSLTPAQAYPNSNAAAASSSTSVNHASGTGSLYSGHGGSASALPSPASNVFPHRTVSASGSQVPPARMPGSIHVGDSDIGTAISPDYAATTPMPQPSGSAYRSASQSQAPGPRRPTVEVGYGPSAPSASGAEGRYSGGQYQQAQGGHADYLRSLDNLSLGGDGDDGPGMLGDIPGIPKRGDESPTVKEFSSLAARFSGEYGRDSGTSLFERLTGPG